MKATINKTWQEMDEGNEYVKVELVIKLKKKEYIKMINSSYQWEVEINGNWN